MSDFHDLDPDEQSAPERAFRVELEFRGKKLKPFSFVRQTAAVALGLKYGSLSDDDIKTHPNPKWNERMGLLSILHDEPAEAIDAAGGEAKIMARVEELADEPESITLYDGLVMDAAIVLWLCSQPDSVCQRARRKPREFETQIDKWADENGIVINSPHLAEATALFGEIMQGTADSRGEPDLDKSAKESDPN